MRKKQNTNNVLKDTIMSFNAGFNPSFDANCNGTAVIGTEPDAIPAGCGSGRRGYLKALLILLCFILMFGLASCGTKDAGNGDDQDVVSTGYVDVLEDQKYGSAFVGISIEAFNDLGFDFGDSVDVIFSNGYTLEDLPYYNGYYTLTGEYLVCGYPNNEHPAIAIAQGDSVWALSGAAEGDTVCVNLREKAKYLDVQKAFSLEYSNNREDYSSDSEFANFRCIAGGNLRRDFFYRSASPVDNRWNRATYAVKLMADRKVGFVVNLADNESELAKYYADSSVDTSYYHGLYDKGAVLPLSLGANYRSESYNQKLAEALLAMANQKEPVLFHCLEGKDRTGFACALLLSLAGASEDEIIDDYMATYENYYGVIESTNPGQYQAIVDVKAKDFLYYLAGRENGESLEGADYVEGAKNYLKAGGLTDAEISKIEKFVTKK